MNRNNRKAALKERRPVWYFFHKTLPALIGKFFGSRFKDIKHWIAHRTYDQYHWVRVHGMKPGYADVDSRMMFACFGLLVDFVECEKASMNRWSDSDHPRHKQTWKERLLPWTEYRNIEDGLAHLDWEISLVHNENDGVHPDDPEYGKPTHQALAAAEEKIIYLWFTKTRPNRPDEHDFCGWSAQYERRSKGEEISDKELYGTLYPSTWMEAIYHKEDEEMLCRLMRIRRNLWT